MNEFKGANQIARPSFKHVLRILSLGVLALLPLVCRAGQDDAHYKLLNGIDVVFDEKQPESERSIPSEWLKEAAAAKVSISLEFAIIQDSVDCESTVFEKKVNFEHCDFVSYVNFTYATFKDGCAFTHASFDSSVDFDSASITGTAAFDDVGFERGLECDGATINGEFTFQDCYPLKTNVVFSFINVSFLQAARFSYCEFSGPANFIGASFSGDVTFDTCHADRDCDFKEARFMHTVSFNDVHFAGDLRFSGANLAKDLMIHSGSTLDGSAWFDGTHLGGNVDLSGFLFNGPTTFENATLDGNAGFTNVVFSNVANFKTTRFSSRANFAEARFCNATSFDGARFDDVAEFPKSSFSANVNFSNSHFSRLSDFRGARFDGTALFAGVIFDGYLRFGVSDELPHFAWQFNGKADFSGSQFNSVAQFGEATFKEDLVCDFCRFSLAPQFQNVLFGRNLGLKETSFPAIYFSSTGTVRNQTQFGGCVDLRGATYQRMQTELTTLLRAVGKVIPYDRQQYTQLEKALQSVGLDDDGNAVYLERMTLEHERIRSPVHRVFDSLYRWLANYGVQPYRLVVISFVLVMLGAAVFRLPFSVSTKDDEENVKQLGQERLSWTRALLLSLRYFVPVTLPVMTRLVASDGRVALVVPLLRPIRSVSLNPAACVTFLLTLPGWILVPLGVAAVSGLLKIKP